MQTADNKSHKAINKKRHKIEWILFSIKMSVIAMAAIVDFYNVPLPSFALQL